MRLPRIPRRHIAQWSRSTLQHFAYLAIDATLSGTPHGAEAEAARILRVGLHHVPRRDLIPWALAGRDLAMIVREEMLDARNE